MKSLSYVYILNDSLDSATCVNSSHVTAHSLDPQSTVNTHLSSRYFFTATAFQISTHNNDTRKKAPPFSDHIIQASINSFPLQRHTFRTQANRVERQDHAFTSHLIQLNPGDPLRNPTIQVNQKPTYFPMRTYLVSQKQHTHTHTYFSDEKASAIQPQPEIIHHSKQTGNGYHTRGPTIADSKNGNGYRTEIPADTATPNGTSSALNPGAL